MIVAGCDVGSLTTKAVVMRGKRVLGSVLDRSKTKPWEAAKRIMDQAIAEAGPTKDDIQFCVGTGYGRDKLAFVDDTVSEIACHGRGARWLLPSVKTVIDIGGQDCKAIKLGDAGDVVKFITNDKCASGTGRFLEVMAKVLGVGIEDLGEMSKRAKSPVTFASACTVWAQADVIQHLNNKVHIDDIGAGINNAMASRMAILVNSIGAEGDICMTGGVAKNVGVISALEKSLGVRIKRIKRFDPQLIGALGAALIARDRFEKRGAQ